MSSYVQEYDLFYPAYTGKSLQTNSDLLPTLSQGKRVIRNMIHVLLGDNTPHKTTNTVFNYIRQLSSDHV